MTSMTHAFSFFFFQQLIYFSNGQNNNIVKAGYWLSDRGLAINNIDSTLFTHLFCAFADLDFPANQLIVLLENQDYFRQFTRTVLQKNPSVKTILSIGGGAANKTAYGIMARTNSSRKSFIDSSIRLAREFGFHGLDLGWQYSQSTSDMTNLDVHPQSWIGYLSAAEAKFECPLENTLLFTYILNSAALLFTATVSASPQVDNSLSYPIQSVAYNLDWINLRAYEFYGPNWSPSQTNSHAQLFDPSNQGMSGSNGISDWNEAGVPTRKMVLAIPYCGFAWRLVNANIHGVRAPADGKANVSFDDGSMTYAQIRDFIVQNRATAGYNNTIVGDYCYSGSTWISYDDTQSVRDKVNYIKSQGLLGYYAWHIAAAGNFSVLSEAAAQEADQDTQGGLVNKKRKLNRLVSILVPIGAILTLILLVFIIWHLQRRQILKFQGF
ncbi:hypothetical protein P3S68_032759 [Capsicum galapagoense]